MPKSKKWPGSIHVVQEIDERAEGLPQATLVRELLEVAAFTLDSAFAAALPIAELRAESAEFTYTRKVVQKLMETARRIEQGAAAR